MKAIGNMQCESVKRYRLWTVLSLLAIFLFSCTVDDLIGEKERYQILNKNSGTLVVHENYVDEACCYEVGENDLSIGTIEFLPDGNYVVKYFSEREDNYNYYRSIRLNVSGKTVDVPISLSKTENAETRAYENLSTLAETGTYTYENGRYVLLDKNWWVENGVLHLDYYGNESVTLTKSEKVEANAITSRLCHRWKLEQVLLKLYKDDKLCFSYQLPQSEMEEYCVSDVVFTQYGTFLRYDEAYRAGTGKWHWTNRTEQELYYKFDYPIIGENGLTVYFSGNHFYMTEEIEALNESDDDDEVLKAVCLYKMSVVGNK